LRVTHDGRRITVEVTPDGDGLVSHAGSALLSQVADKVGLRRALSLCLGDLKARRCGHDVGRVVRDLAVMLADGGDCLADLRALGDQQALFGQVASSSTAFRVIDRIASDPGGLERLRAAHADARARAWKLGGAPAELDIDVDATLLGAHSDKEGAAGNFKGGFGFHPMLAYGDQIGEALAGELRAGNAGPTPPPTRSRSPSRRCSRSRSSTSRTSRSGCAPTRPAPATNCWTGAATAPFATRSVMT
jgi:DDE family transposase